MSLCESTSKFSSLLVAIIALQLSIRTFVAGLVSLGGVVVTFTPGSDIWKRVDCWRSTREFRDRYKFFSLERLI